MQVGDRQRVAIDPVAGPEVALEVGGPQIVGLRHGHGDDPGMLNVAPAAALLHQPPARQEIAGGADGGPVHGGMPWTEPRHELGGAPAGMLAPRRTDHGRDLTGNAVGASMRRSAPVPQALPARILEALEPFVARLPTDAVPRTEPGHRVRRQPVIANEPFSLLHR